MLARAIIPSTLFLAGSAVAGAVHPARDVTTSSVVPVTHKGNQPFTSVIAATSYAYYVTQPVPTPSYVGDGVQAWSSSIVQAYTSYVGDGVQSWSSSVGPTYTSAPCYCPVPVSIPPPGTQTSSLSEPIISTVTIYPSFSGIPTAVTSSIQEPSATTKVVTVRDIADAVTSSLPEPTPTTMVVTVLPTSSGIPGPVTMCACGTASSSGTAVTSSQSFVDQTTQPAGVPTTQSIQGVVTTRAVSTSSQTETASVGNNLLLNANSAVMEVVSVQLVAIATLFGVVGAGFTLI